MGALPPTAAAAQLAARNSSRGAHQVVRPGADPLRVAEQHWVPAGMASSSSSSAVGSSSSNGDERLHPLHRDALGELVEHLGELRVLLGQRRARSRTDAVSSSSRQGGAHSRGRPARWSAGRRRRRCGSPPPRRPRTRPGTGARRWAGRRRGCRPGRRTRPAWSTRSTRVYARSTSRRATSSRSTSSPARAAPARGRRAL